LSSDIAFDELRLTTRAEHDRLQHVLRLGEAMTLDRYGAILRGFDVFLRSWEPRIHGALPARLQPWFRARRRGGFASADVEWLRAVANIAPAAMTPRLAATLPLGDLPEALGSLYVIETLALDGRAAAPLLKQTLDIGQGRGASFFHGFGGESAAMWTNFRVLAALEIGDALPNARRACQSALRTFAALLELFAPLAVSGSADGPSSRPSPLADIHIDLPDDDDPEPDQALVELPIDDGEDDGGDTLRMPL
jgi:heme oxygenase (biliverdin-IX-beta and delta-forming)